MADDTIRKTVVVSNEQGFHMRPAAAFVVTAQKFPDCQVSVAKEGNPPINGRSLLSLIGLNAPEGTELIIEVSGLSAAEAMQALLEVFKLKFDE